MGSLEYATDGLVFRLQESANGFDSHMQIYTQRHFDNANANGTMPWAMEEIKVKADNGAFAFNPSLESFKVIADAWVFDPVAMRRIIRDEICRIENAERHAENVRTEIDSENAWRANN